MHPKVSVPNAEQKIPSMHPRAPHVTTSFHFPSVLHPPQEIGLYVHIPFCTKKCPYCAFYKVTGREESEGLLVEALQKEIQAIHKRQPHLIIKTLFIGGGTPSRLSPLLLERLLSTIFSTFHRHSDLESTIEMNPETVTRDKLRAISPFINRVSLGVQSLDKSELQTLGRAHTISMIEKTVTLLHDENIKNFNLDLMFALPGSELKTLEKTLQKIVSYNPTHISAYSLTIEEGTMFAKKNIKKGDQDLDLAQFQLVRSTLQEKGFIPYEISNFAKPGFECQHNLTYWNFGNYLGIGPSAASFWENRRFQHPEDLDQYIKDPSPKIFDSPPETQETLLEEFLISQLLLRTGLSLDETQKRFGPQPFIKREALIQKLEEEQFLKRADSRIIITEKGIPVLDEILLKLL